jgi:xanthine dehydrogenase accessory factor
MGIYRLIADMEEKRLAGALCTIIQAKGSTPRHETSKMLVYEDGSFTGTVGGGEVEQRVRAEALQSISDGKSRRLSYNLVNPEKGDPGVCGGAVEVYVEPVLPNPTLIIIGGGHVGRALSYLAKWSGFYVVVNDDRPEFCSAEQNPDADELIVCPMAELPQKVKIDPRTYLVLATRGSSVDVDGLGPLLALPARFIGVIGSKRRWLTTRNGLLEQGLSENDINRIHSPVGLELNAETPEEIAVSIMAEIIMLKNGGTGEAMKI